MPLAVAGAAVLASGAAQALTIELTDGTATETVVDGGGGDSAGDVGVVAYQGSVGGWDMNFTAGFSEPALPLFQLDLNNVSLINLDSGSGTLKVSVWHTFQSSSVSGFTGSIGGTTDGSVSVTYSQTKVQTKVGDAAVGLSSASAGPFEPSDPNNTSFSAGGTYFANNAVGDPFDLRIDVEIKHEEGDNISSFDAQVKPVPLPAAAWLFGSALLGVVAIGRRKQSRAA